MVSCLWRDGTLKMCCNTLFSASLSENHKVAFPCCLLFVTSRKLRRAERKWTRLSSCTTPNRPTPCYLRSVLCSENRPERTSYKNRNKGRKDT